MKWISEGYRMSGDTRTHVCGCGVTFQGPPLAIRCPACRVVERKRIAAESNRKRSERLRREKQA